MEKYADSESESSGGQQQRILIAKAMISSPEILFLDEPQQGLTLNPSRIL
jgi:zinc transport system ATP-binding protein